MNDMDKPADAVPEVDLDRRAALAKMGKFAGVTAPVVLTLLTTDATEAWAVSGKRSHPHPRPPRPRFPRFFR